MSELCKHGNYHCQICEIVLHKRVISEYERENIVLKARIAELEQEVKELSEEIMWRSSP